MRSILKSVMVILILFSSYASAGKDPINWSLDRSFPSPSIVGRTYTVTYTFTNQLPFKLVKPLVINKNATPAADFTYTDNCTGQKLNSNASCTVSITLTANTAGTKSVQLIISGYDNNKVPVPMLTTEAQGENPLSSQISGNVLFPGSLSVGVPANYIFTFVNNGVTDVSGVSVGVTQSSGVANDVSSCGTTILAGKSCHVTGSYTPTSSTPTIQNVTAVLSYSGTKSATVTASAPVTNAIGVNASFTIPDYLPAVMVGGPSNTKLIQGYFFNNSGVTITVSARDLAITTGGGSGTLTLDTSPANDNCLLPGGGAKPLLQGQACVVTGTFEGDTVLSDTNVAITASLTYSGYTGSPATAVTSTYLVPSLSASRTVTLLNNCPFPVWFSYTGGHVTGKDNCPTDACPTPGSTCNTTNHKCYWDTPGPNTGTYQLNANGGTTTTTIPYNPAVDPTVLWSGGLSASLRCDAGGQGCLVAPCDNQNGTTSCGIAKGFEGAATQAEFTLLINNVDTYDVEVINGFHIPISMKPSESSHTSPVNYTCGNAGAYTAGNGFGSCNWNTATPPSASFYTMVTSGGSTDASQCATNEIYGIALVQNSDNTVTPAKVQSCGYFLGYWTADEICGSNPTKGQPIANYFQCYASLGSPFASGTTYSDLMFCAVPKSDTTNPTFNSCYLDYGSEAGINQCCGCKNWWEAGIGANSNAQQCVNPTTGAAQTNPTWNSQIQPTIQWLKAACPSAYVYTFDDKTSTFQCSTNLPNSLNSTNYTITFCEGASGLSAGKYDGRKNPPSMKKPKSIDR